ncbi:MAG: hypothetical protein IT581_06450 [Verrucomicrobiales bacterium]|nr:hypothetical protein [Verrucomicrobiales bacterium]
MNNALVEGKITAGSFIAFQPGAKIDLLFVEAGPAINVSPLPSGEFSIRLEAGEYVVSIGGVALYRIVVPPGLGKYDYTSLIRESYPVATANGASWLVASVKKLLAKGGEWVSRGGDTMTGPLILSESPDDDSPDNQAATKGYVNARVPSVARFTHTQTSPSSEWVIPHGLNSYPQVTVRDLGTTQEKDGDVQYPNANEVRILWGSPETGVAELI